MSEYPSQNTSVADVICGMPLSETVTVSTVPDTGARSGVANGLEQGAVPGELGFEPADFVHRGRVALPDDATLDAVSTGLSRLRRSLYA
jgi:hypothetical protein